MRETRVRSLGWEDPLEKEMAAHSSIVAWKILWTEPGRLQSMGTTERLHFHFTGHSHKVAAGFHAQLWFLGQARASGKTLSMDCQLEWNTLATWYEELTGKDPDAGKDWRQVEKGTKEDEMAGWHHWFDGHEFEQAPGVGDGLGSLACCSPWGRKESDTTEQLNWTAAQLSMLLVWPQQKTATSQQHFFMSLFFSFSFCAISFWSYIGIELCCVCIKCTGT